MITEMEFYDILVKAWTAGEEERYHDALELYKEAEDNLPSGMWFSPRINLLRHGPGTPDFLATAKGGAIIPFEATEDQVMGVCPPPCDAEKTNKGLHKTKIDYDSLKQNIIDFHCSLGYHKQNLSHFDPIPHLFFMSTGRCGTMSVYKLLRKTMHLPHHSYYFHPSYSQRLEAMCRMIDGNYDSSFQFELWMKTKAGEWMWPTLIGRPTAFVSHLDTIYAPVFALLHPKARFIYLRRNKEDVYTSMYTKNQWGDQQLRPVWYTFEEHFKYKDWGTISQQIKWGLEFTEKFCRAFGEVYPDRFMEISSDKLFAQDRKEVKKLVDFGEMDISLNAAVEHFGTKINEKRHKKVETL